MRGLTAEGGASASDVRAAGRVGEPIHERELVDAFLSQVPGLFPPGPGRSTYVLHEVEVGAGRPDVVILTISATAFEAFRRSGLRLSGPLAARALDLTATDIGATSSHLASIRRDLRKNGWFDLDLQRAARMVHDSIAVEAKMKDWKQAMRQVSRFRGHFQRTAVVMPARTVPEQMRTSISFYQCGLLFRGDNSFEWDVEPTRRHPADASSIWLLELLNRGLDDGSAYRLRSSASRSSASP